MNETITTLAPKLLVLITDSTRAKKAEEILRKSGLHVQYRFRGKGTASSEILEYLGLDGNDKSIYISVVPQKGVGRLIELLSEKLTLEKSGHGILFTVLINGISNPAMKLLNDQIQKELQEKTEIEVARLTEKSKYNLLLAIANRGYSEEVMETAKSAGARGGTVIHSRRLGMEDALKLWGISIQDEREIIAIVAEKDNKINIMRAIGEKHGVKSEAQGLILSIPVEDIAGMQ